MSYSVISSCIVVIALALTGCTLGWKPTRGVQTLRYQVPISGSPLNVDANDTSATKSVASTRVSFVLPDGWHWVMRGDDLIATRDGVFLQNIHYERIGINQVKQSDGMFPLAALSSKQWPFRMVPYLKKRLELGMSPADAADVVLSSRANTPGVSDFEIQEVVMQEIGGYQGFKAVYDFKLAVYDFRFKDRQRMTAYKAVCFGFMRNEWFYGITYTAARRYYFQKDAGVTDSVLQSFRLIEK
ncbi:MAG TPA: hypothetical protein VLX29_11330 [Nitrospirota bacterium]|nr:hypothetical protein [Nitrospirota bacterium]